MADSILDSLPSAKQKKTRTHNPSKQKGKRGETCAAELLTQILGHNFTRIYCSGASVGRSNSYRLEQLTKGQALSQLGDVMPPEYMKSQFVIESKNYADLDFHALLTPKGSTQLTGWYNEMMFDCESALTLMADKTNKKPVIGFLFVKITRKGEWCVFDERMMDIAINGFDLPVPSLRLSIPARERLVAAGWSGQCYMCDFETFLVANKEKLGAVNESEYATYLSGGPKKLEDASIEDLERMLAAKKGKTQ